jgi:hypothetical protein
LQKNEISPGNKVVREDHQKPGASEMVCKDAQGPNKWRENGEMSGRGSPNSDLSPRNCEHWLYSLQKMGLIWVGNPVPASTLFLLENGRQLQGEAHIFCVDQLSMTSIAHVLGQGPADAGLNQTLLCPFSSSLKGSLYRTFLNEQ